MNRITTPTRTTMLPPNSQSRAAWKAAERVEGPFDSGSGALSSSLAVCPAMETDGGATERAAKNGSSRGCVRVTGLTGSGADGAGVADARSASNSTCSPKTRSAISRLTIERNASPARAPGMPPNSTPNPSKSHQIQPMNAPTSIPQITTCDPLRVQYLPILPAPHPGVHVLRPRQARPGRRGSPCPRRGQPRCTSALGAMLAISASPEQTSSSVAALCRSVSKHTRSATVSCLRKRTVGLPGDQAWRAYPHPLYR